MIKARIEALIEREYLERSETNMKIYQYLVVFFVKMRLIDRHKARRYQAVEAGVASVIWW
jgi:hypothetical protein